MKAKETMQKNYFEAMQPPQIKYPPPPLPPLPPPPPPLPQITVKRNDLAKMLLFDAALCPGCL